MRWIPLLCSLLLVACSAGLSPIQPSELEAPEEAPEGDEGVDEGEPGEHEPEDEVEQDDDDDDATEAPEPPVPLAPLGERRCDGLPALPTFPPDAPGPYAVGVQTLLLEDPKRSGRILTTELWYPTDTTGAGVSYGLGLEDVAGMAGDDWGGLLALMAMFNEDDLVTVVETAAVRDAPVHGDAGALVVFSHGFRGVRWQSTFLTTWLASHGYAVAAPDHVGNTMFDGSEEAEESVMSRVLDVAFVADELSRRAADPGDPLFEAFDASRVGVVGHSFGASTAINGGAMDNREMVNIPLAPAFDERMSHVYAPESYDLRAAITIVGGTDDNTTEWPMQELAYERTVAPRHLVQLDGARHFDFTDLCANELIRFVVSSFVEQLADACGPEPGLYHDAIRTVTTASLGRYLACDADAGEWLQPEVAGAIDRVSEVRADFGQDIAAEAVAPAAPQSTELPASAGAGVTLAILPTPGFDVGLFAPLVERLGDELDVVIADPTDDLSDAVVLGWGAGGQAALQVPALARVLIGAAARDQMDWLEHPGYYGGRTLTSVARVEEGDWDAVVDGLFACSEPDPAHAEQALSALDPSAWPEPGDVLAALPSAVEPTLLLHGEGDDTVLLESSLYLWNELPEAQLVVLQRSGHLPFREEPDVVAAEILLFIEGL